jgi:hypothetical protein
MFMLSFVVGLHVYETNLAFMLNSKIVMKQMLHESIIAGLGLGIAHSSLYECH